MTELPLKSSFSIIKLLVNCIQLVYLPVHFSHYHISFLMHFVNFPSSSFQNSLTLFLGLISPLNQNFPAVGVFLYFFRGFGFMSKQLFFSGDILSIVFKLFLESPNFDFKFLVLWFMGAYFLLKSSRFNGILISLHEPPDSFEMFFMFDHCFFSICTP